MSNFVSKSYFVNNFSVLNTRARALVRASFRLQTFSDKRKDAVLHVKSLTCDRTEEKHGVKPQSQDRHPAAHGHVFTPRSHTGPTAPG